MNTNILTKDKDPMGAAILDYQTSGKAGKLRVLSSMFEEDEMPVKHLFRSFEEMPKLEQKALMLAKGKVLDVGAGAGCHALALQEGIDYNQSSTQTDTTCRIISVKAIDISPLSCEAMRLRGVKDAECINLFDEHLSSGKSSANHSDTTEEGSAFDTILLLMNGTGIAGKIANLPALFHRLKALLNPGGQILIDSSDLKYIYENEDGSFDINLAGAYYGEVDYQMVYDGLKNPMIHNGQKKKDENGKIQKAVAVKGEPFDWLYVDFPLLKSIAESCGLHCELVAEGEHYDYLARICQ